CSTGHSRNLTIGDRSQRGALRSAGPQPVVGQIRGAVATHVSMECNDSLVIPLELKAVSVSLSLCASINRGAFTGKRRQTARLFRDEELIIRAAHVLARQDGHHRYLAAIVNQRHTKRCERLAVAVAG